MNANSNTLLNGKFLVGDRNSRRAVVEQDYPCEYSMLSYLAAATAGEPIGMGELHLPTLMSQEEVDEWFPYRGPSAGEAQLFFEANIVYIPNVGLWLCAPAFKHALHAREDLKAVESVLAQRAGMPRGELPLNIALIECVPGVPSDPSGVNEDEIYDTNLFADVIGEFTKRARPLPRGFDLEATAAKILAHGTLIDAKGDYYDDWQIPRWLDEMLERKPDPRI